MNDGKVWSVSHQNNAAFARFSLSALQMPTGIPITMHMKVANTTMYAVIMARSHHPARAMKTRKASVSSAE